MYFIETKATRRLPHFGHLPLNTYLSVVCIAAVATELGRIKTHSFLQMCFKSKIYELCIILYLLIVALAINTALKTVR
jgi:hypothetical protein